MQWDAGPNAGFAAPAARPWLPLPADFPQVNVAAQKSDPRSILSLYRRLIDLRRAEPALAYGEFEPLTHGDDVLAYRRWHRDREFLVALNFGSQPQDLGGATGRIVLSTYLDGDGERSADSLRLRPDEGLIVQVQRI
jgi:alpha-glucosidase